MTTRNCLQILLATIAMIFTSPVGAFAGSGATSGDFLTIPVFSRGTALSGAWVADAGGAGALYYNPAGIARDRSGEISVSHSELLQDLRLNNISLAIPTPRGGIGLGVTYLGYGNINGYDAAGIATGSLHAFSLALQLGYAQRLSDVLSVGAVAKPMIERLDAQTARTVTFDFGLRADFGRVAFGAQYANVGGSLQFLNERMELPRALRVGASLRTAGLGSTFSVAAAKEKGEAVSLGGGLEYQYNSMLTFRGGYGASLERASSASDGFSVGAGMLLGNLMFDYTYRPTATSEGVHYITASVRLGR